MAPKVAPLVKQLGMKAIDVIRDKGISVVGDLAGKAFSAVKNKITSLVKSRSRKQPPMVKPLPPTTMMPAKVRKAINNAVEEKLESLAAEPVDTQSSNIASMIAGSGLLRKRNHRN